MSEHFLVSRQTGLPVGVVDEDELKRRAACIALRCMQGVARGRRVEELLVPAVAEYSVETRALLLVLVVTKLLSSGTADTLRLAMDLRPELLDQLRKEAGE